MSNILNSTNTVNNNVIAARKLKSRNNNETGIIDAPQSLYKYSLTEQMHKYDNFQKEINYNAEKSLERRETKKRNKGIFVALAGIIAIVAASLKLTKS